MLAMLWRRSVSIVASVGEGRELPKSWTAFGASQAHVGMRTQGMLAPSVARSVAASVGEHRTLPCCSRDEVVPRGPSFSARADLCVSVSSSWTAFGISQTPVGHADTRMRKRKRKPVMPGNPVRVLSWDRRSVSPRPCVGRRTSACVWRSGSLAASAQPHAGYANGLCATLGRARRGRWFVFPRLTGLATPPSGSYVVATVGVDRRQCG
jgi:hypothetical protein